MRWADVNGAALRYEVTGQGHPDIVLIHEMGGTLESWDRVVSELARDHRVLRYDCRGAGLSEKIRGAVTIDDFAGDLLALTDVVGMNGRAVFAGCAVGAAVALKLAADHPNRVAGVIAMAPALHVPPDRRDFALRRADEVEAEGMRPMTIAGHDRAYPVSLRDDPELENDVKCRKLACDPSSFAAVQRMLADLDMTTELKKIACPTLFLAGSLDGTRPPEMVAAYAAEVAGSSFETIVSGHGMAYLAAPVVVEQIRRFSAAASLADTASGEC